MFKVGPWWLTILEKPQFDWDYAVFLGNLGNYLDPQNFRKSRSVHYEASEKNTPQKRYDVSSWELTTSPSPFDGWQHDVPFLWVLFDFVGDTVHGS